MKDKIYNNSQRIISMLLSFVMVISFFPSHAFAVNSVSDTVRVIIENQTYSKADGAAWDGVLIDEEIPIDSSTTMMSAVKQAIESKGYTQTGAENNFLTEVNGLKSGTVTSYAGWMGTLNDWFTDKMFGDFTVADGTLVAGDEIRIMYSLDMGADCGGSWGNNDTTVKSVEFSAGQLEKPFEIGVAGTSYTNKLIVPKGTNEIVVTPTATNKNFQVRTFVEDKEYKRGQKIPVSNGTGIKVKCGDPSWPSMNNNDETKATEYSFEVSVHNSAPALKKGIEKEASSKVGIGNNYTVDLSKIFEDADNDKLTYNVKVNGAQSVAANEQYSYKCDSLGTTVLEFTASDDIQTSESYKVNITVKENSAPSISSLSIESDSRCYMDLFDGKQLETTVVLPKNTEKITINAKVKSDDSKVTFNGGQSNTINVLEIDKIEIVVSNNSEKTIYTVKLDKRDLFDFNFKTNVDNANVTVYDRDKNQIIPNSNGIYSAMTSAVEHTYKISKNGYVTKTGVVPENGGEIYVELVKPEGEQPQEVNAFWPSFRGNEFNLAITSARTPQTEDKANIYTKWTKKLGKSWNESPSAQIIVDDSLIVMAGKKLYKLDLNTGDIVAQADMAQSPNWGYTPPTYGNGMIFCPLDYGTIQAFNAKTLEPLWIYKDESKGQSLSAITYSDGHIYTGFWNGETKDSNYVCISTTDEDINSKDEEKTAVWTYTNKGGFYWAGSVVIGDAVIFGMDNGAGETEFDVKSKICSFNKYTGEIISQFEITGDQRSSVTYDKETQRIYFTTKSGYLYRADVNAQTGELSNLKYSNSFNKQSTATPVVYKGRVYSATGGGVGRKGEIVVADAESLETLFVIGLKGYPQCSLLLSNAYEEQTGSIYLYSTYNAMPGGIYALKVKVDCQTADDVELVEIYDAKGFENYCISSVICGNDGTLYYKNDSGYIFAVGIPDSVNVEKLIDAIGEVTTSSKGLISAARGAYEALQDSEKQNVKNYDVLVKAEKDYIDLQKAVVVDKKIDEIGKVTLMSFDKIINARKAYNELTVSEKSFVSKYDVLVAAEVEYEKIEKEAVSNVEELINKIGNVTLESEGKINEARNAYNALPAHVQKKVSNYNKLEQAEITLNKLKNTNNNTVKPNKNKKPSKDKLVLNKSELLTLQSKFEKVNEETSYNDALDLIKTYYKLTEEQQLALADTEELKLIQDIIAKENHKDKETGISILDSQWNIKLYVKLADKEKINSEIADKLNDKTLLGIWDIKLVDVLTNEEYKPENIVTIKIPVELITSIKDYDELSVLHYHDKDKLEFLSCELVDNTIVFKASEFSYYGIVGTKISEQKDSSVVIEETPQMTESTNNSIPWIWWAIAGGLLIVVLGVLIVIKRKTTDN